MRVKKTSLYIDPEIDRALARRAATEGVTKAALIRQALAIAAGDGQPRPSAAGVFEGPPNLGVETDRHLAESRFGEQ